MYLKEILVIIWRVLEKVVILRAGKEKILRQNEEIIAKFPHFACISQRIIPPQNYY